MKVLVISDTHKDISRAEQIIKRLKRQVDYVIHLGDHIKDAQDLGYIHDDIHFECVVGNCDWSHLGETQKVVLINGKKFLIAHGHTYGVKHSLSKLISKVKKLELDGAFYGHTHVPTVYERNGILIMNPGSLTIPRTSQGPTYGIVEVTDDGNVRAEIVPCKN